MGGGAVFRVITFSRLLIPNLITLGKMVNIINHLNQHFIWQLIITEPLIFQVYYSGVFVCVCVCVCVCGEGVE